MSCLGAFILPAVALVILLGLMLALAIVGLPSQARQKFGPPASNLSRRQLFTYSALLVFQANDLNRPGDPLGEPRPFTVALNESTQSVIGRLWEEGLIPNPGAFNTYLRYTGLDTSIQAGDYSLSPAMTPVEIAHTLQDATPTQVDFTVLAGWRIEEIAASLPTSGLEISPEEFIQAASARPADYSFTAELESPTLEGFLFPGVYVIQRDSTAGELVRTLLDSFEQQVGSDIREGFSRQGLSLYEGVILASIVEREAVVEDEMPLIASVFLNRLQAGIKLDSDPTVQYARGFNSDQDTWWTNPLSLDDLAIDSPYNTYVYPGLPPTPIANPGLSALHAVAFPAQTPYYYFRATCDGLGKHTFAETLEEHIQNACP